MMQVGEAQIGDSVPTPRLPKVGDCQVIIGARPEIPSSKIKNAALEISEIYFQASEAQRGSEFVEVVYMGATTLNMSG
ncbi:MAG: hypothetical protein ACKVHP_14590 [Verrucomicrobiales bacterium]